MIVYCKKCGINWARLWTDTKGECEFCPVCNTDSFIEQGNDLTAYIKCPISGRITDVATGALYIPPFVKPKYRIQLKQQRHRVTREEHEEIEERAIDAYTSGGSRQQYFEILKRK